MPFVGTAGWLIPGSVAARFPTEGSALARYSAVFNAVEINSTFYRRHKLQTIQRWANSVPEDFRFSVKLPKQITHELRLADLEQPLLRFLSDIEPLGAKLGPLLCQLPPTLEFGGSEVNSGLRFMRKQHGGEIVIEPRHESWASDGASDLLDELTIDRVVADPIKIAGMVPADEGFRYLRLHGKPKIYYSSYSSLEIGAFSEMLSQNDWCIFDNTASDAAIENALEMVQNRETRR
ncbi:DUF72 domain-containing protein [Rhizobium tubonense]|uniref:DUF72 domain-containing protein n=1 Tax=Rhizobium tubonense TaxID=484088 RepID=A0A2W4DGB3_9HYPH|nr:DUF72 domain-containing protein [Rhizobium tubonense]PZM15524.1 hypothetical protein CPY51_06765 [Rhizobium tubonense]